MCYSGKSRRRSLTFGTTNESNTASPSTCPDSVEKQCVQHNYHDHSQDIERDSETPVVSKGGVTVPFPMKLFDMLVHIELVEPELSEIVSWLPHGRSFLVRKPKEFTATVLPRFFQQKKYASFQRQLNLYGFNRITKGSDRGSYYHELFLRGKKFLCRGINRMKVKGTGARMASNPDAEPDFYKMTSMGPSIDDLSTQTSPARSTPLQVKSSSALSHQSPFADKVASASVVPATKYIPPTQSMPPLPQHTVPKSLHCSNTKRGSFTNFDFVFGNMPFHSVDASSDRRNSLLEIPSRASFQFQQFTLPRRESIRAQGPAYDDALLEEMDMLSSAVGDGALNDLELGYILEKL